MAKTKPKTQNVATQPAEKRSYKGIIIATAVIVVLLAGALFIFKPSSVGQAYRFDPVTGQRAGGDVENGGQAVFMKFGKGFAALNDDVTIPIHLNAPANQDVNSVTFCLGFDVAKFQVTSVTLNPAIAWSSATQRNEARANAINGNGACADGFSQTITLLSGTGGQQLVGTDTFLAKVTFRVLQSSVGGADNDNTFPITLKTPEISGSGGFSSAVTPDSSSEIVLVPVCPDADNDGYAALGTVQAEGVAGSDMRACRHTNPLGGNVVLDCDDNAATRYPGNAEICDGLDNDCNNNIDDGLEIMEVLNEVPADAAGSEGVCLGHKRCVAGVAQNSYTLRDDVENQFDAYYGTEVCDAFDNDCDGQINEDLAECSLAGGVAPSPNVGLIISKEPGNTYIDYGADNQHLPVQALSFEDRWLLNKYINIFDPDVDAGCGDPGDAPCDRVWDAVADTHVHLCKSGTYYLEYRDVNPAEVYKLSPDGALQSGLTTADIANC